MEACAGAAVVPCSVRQGRLVKLAQLLELVFTPYSIHYTDDRGSGLVLNATPQQRYETTYVLPGMIKPC